MKLKKPHSLRKYFRKFLSSFRHLSTLKRYFDQFLLSVLSLRFDNKIYEENRNDTGVTPRKRHINQVAITKVAKLFRKLYTARTKEIIEASEHNSRHGYKHRNLAKWN